MKKKTTFAKPRNIVKQKKKGLTWAPKRAGGCAAELWGGCEVAGTVHAGASHRGVAGQPGLCQLEKENKSYVNGAPRAPS